MALAGWWPHYIVGSQLALKRIVSDSFSLLYVQKCGDLSRHAAFNTKDEIWHTLAFLGVVMICDEVFISTCLCARTSFLYP